MKLIETIVTETSVRMRYADAADQTKASCWIDFQFPIGKLKHPSNEVEMEPHELQVKLLAEVHQAALRVARDELNDEIQRFGHLAGRTNQ